VSIIICSFCLYPGKSAAIILRKINEKSFSIAEDLFWKESLHKLKSLSLDPVCPDQLVWNPLFSDNTDESQKTLRLKKATKQKTKIREKKVVHSVVQSMLKKVVSEAKKEQQTQKKVLTIVSGMTQRVCTAERLQFDISETQKYQVFRLMDNIVSFCEFPGIRLRRNIKRKRNADVAETRKLMKPMLSDIENSM
jgi:hypothetical protein